MKSTKCNIISRFTSKIVNSAKNLTTAAVIIYSGTNLSACTFDSSLLDRLKPTYVVDAPTEPTEDIDPSQSDTLDVLIDTYDASDAGDDTNDLETSNISSCQYNPNLLPLFILTPIYFGSYGDDVQQRMENQRVYEGGLTLGELFEYAADNGTVFSGSAFKAYIDTNPVIATVLKDDLASRIESVTCETDDSQIARLYSEFLDQLFSGGFGDQHFRLRDTNSIYLAFAEGNDGIARSYFIAVGETVVSDGSQPGAPVVLYITDVDNTLNLMISISQGGI